MVDATDVEPGYPAGGSPPSNSDRHSSFDEFFRENYAAVVKIGMYLGASFEQADDATSRAMTDAYRSWSRIHLNPFAWTAQAMRHHFFKTKTREEIVGRRSVASRLVQPQLLEMDEPNAWEDVEWVKRQLEALPPAQRDTMALAYDGFRPAEIAEVLGRSPRAVRQSLIQARRKLRLALGVAVGTTDGQEGGGR